MLSQRAALIAAIREAPDDDIPRLVAADWFEEQGDEVNVARAQFIRTQLERAKLPPEDVRQSALQARELRLLKRFGALWCGSHFIFKKVRFRRGFIEFVHLHLRHFLHHRRQMLALEPVRDVRLTGWFRSPIDLVRRVAGCAEWGDIETLRIHHQGPHKDPGASAVELLESPHFTRLRELHCPMLSIDAETRRRFERLRILRTIETFNLPYLDTWSHVPDEWFAQGGIAVTNDWGSLRSLRLPEYLSLDILRQLTEMPFWKRLTALELMLSWNISDTLNLLRDRLPESLRELRVHSSISPANYAGATSFFEAITQLPLERLELHIDPLRVTTLRRLLRAGSRWRLRELNLADCGLSEPHARVLGESPVLNGVWSLNLSGNWNFTAAAVRALTSSKELRSLVHLDLHGTKLGKAGLSVLARARHWPALRSLNLVGVDVTSEALATILSGRGGQQLTWLSLSEQDRTLPANLEFPPHLASLRIEANRRSARLRQQLQKRDSIAWVNLPIGETMYDFRAMRAPERWPPVDETWEWGYANEWL